MFKALAQAATEGLHVEAFEEGPGAESCDGSRVPDLPLIGDPERWLMMHFGIPGLWVTLRDPEAAASELAAGLRVWLDDRELLLEVLEVWHREVVTQQYCDENGWFDGTSRADGQTRLRELDRSWEPKL